MCVITITGLTCLFGKFNDHGACMSQRYTYSLVTFAGKSEERNKTLPIHASCVGLPLIEVSELDRSLYIHR